MAWAPCGGGPQPQCAARPGTLSTGPAPTRHPVDGLLMPAGRPGAPGRGLCHAEAGVPMCQLLTGPIPLRCHHRRREWHHMPGKGQPGVESGSQTRVMAQSFPSKCPAPSPRPPPWSHPARRPPNPLQRKRPPHERRVSVSPAETSLPFSPSHAVSLFSLPASLSVCLSVSHPPAPAPPLEPPPCPSHSTVRPAPQPAPRLSMVLAAAQGSTPGVLCSPPRVSPGPSLPGTPSPGATVPRPSPTIPMGGPLLRASPTLLCRRRGGGPGHSRPRQC